MIEDQEWTPPWLYQPKVGDRVRIDSGECPRAAATEAHGAIGKVIATANRADSHRFLVAEPFLHGVSRSWWCAAAELEPLERQP